MAWIRDVVALEGSTFAGVVNSILIVVVLVVCIRRGELSWARVAQVLALMLATPVAFVVCMALLGFVGIPASP